MATEASFGEGVYDGFEKADSRWSGGLPAGSEEGGWRLAAGG